ncbi:MAG: 16S rRNA (adenine(1518)-N(6)/adenine(1519)-N(6))-dimethyltransferase RsmA [Armatimonadota bacterium]|nr:16S rRNA (adenine(1518)-N(6)/adenine(1519)-N(6))-dimethyltransferase RsmA [Armatimonadota bacterium]
MNQPREPNSIQSTDSSETHLLNLSSLTHVRSLLQQYGLHTRKNLGQHFLVDQNILDAIVEAAELPGGGNTLEIGPGLGTLTRELAHHSGEVVAIEYDRMLVNVLQDTLSALENVKIVEADALRILRSEDVPALFEAPGAAESPAISCVSNLPYNLTSPILIALLERKHWFHSIVLMIQEEVADRLIAKPGTGQYGALTVFVQYHAHVEKSFTVGRQCFYPPPAVGSAVVKLTPLPDGAVPVEDPTRLFQVSRALFGQRRKTAANALMTLDGGKTRPEVMTAFEKAGIDAGRRGEQFSLEEMAALADAMGPG